MAQRNWVVVIGTSAMGLALLLAGCGDFGSGGDEGGSGTGGMAGAAGTGGMAGAAGTSGMAGAAGTGGMAGAAGTGGMGGAGTGGTAAGAGGSGGNEPPPEASCDDVVGCGGDVVGVWFAVDSCLNVGGMTDLTAHGIGCTEAPVEGMLAVTGNWTIAEDGTLTDTTQTTGTINLTLAPECKDLSGTVTQCDAIAGPMFASLGLVREGSTCMDSATIEGGCDCTGIVNQAGAAAFVTLDVAEMGLYATEGNTLTFTGYDVVDYGYCADGNFIHLTPITSNDIGTVTGTVVFQRQP
jgi:hypothetical protein